MRERERERERESESERARPERLKDKDTHKCNKIQYHALHYITDEKQNNKIIHHIPYTTTPTIIIIIKVN